MDDMERRAFMKGAAVGALTFTVGGVEVLLTPRQAHAQNVPLRTLTAEQGATLDAIGEALVPGAKTAGITNFVDQQISGPPEEALLTARILNVRPPYAAETGNRNNYRGDGYFSIDTGISKIFSVTERQQFKFAAEAFNVTNSVRFDPSSVVNDPYFGASTYGQYTALLTQGRRMQFSLRYSF